MAWPIICRNAMGYAQVCQRTDSLQLRVLRLGFFQDRDVRVGVFPEDEEILVGSLGFGGVTCHRVSAPELQTGERAEQEILHDSGMIDKLLEFRGRSGAVLLGEISQAA